MTMPLPVTLICLLCTIWITWHVFRQYARRAHDLLSYRNFFLLGFVHFQCLSGFLSGLTGQPWRGQPFATRSYYIYAIGLVLFTVTFFWAYGRTKIPRIVGKIFPTHSPEPATIWVLAGIVLGVVMGIMSIVVVRLGVPFISQFAAQTVFGGLIFAVVLATYLWVRSPANPFFAILFLALPAFTLFLSTVGTHGRRELVSVLLAIIWAMYIFKWRYDPAIRTLARFAVVSALALVLLVGYTAVRGSAKDRFGLDENDVIAVTKTRLNQLKQASLTESGLMPIIFTDTALCSVLTIDRWGTDNKPHEPFFSIKYFLLNPVPRQWWPDKPIGFGKTLPESLNKIEFNIVTFGPGVIGHGWHEMGIFGIPFYGLVFGFLCKAMDRKLFRQVLNPFFVAAAGSLLGHAVGMPRGDIGVFMVNAIGALIATFGVMVLLGFLSGGSGASAAEERLQEMEAAQYDDQDWSPLYDEDESYAAFDDAEPAELYDESAAATSHDT
ncbi:MAG: hypothetical protein KAS72_00375 [Phycisphaerales bacterium]|nr:hypothetical protein [Phycisphaerales bacterium]